jgi:UPF0716 protein FxsA
VRLAFAGWIVAEGAAFFGLAWAAGVGIALGLFLLTSVVGVILVQYLGAKSLRAVREHVRAGGDPTADLPGGFVVAGAVCLIIPGFVSDLVGLALLFPPTRGLFRWAGRAVTARLPDLRTRRFGEDVIDGEVVDERGRRPGDDERPRVIE